MELFKVKTFGHTYIREKYYQYHQTARYYQETDCYSYCSREEGEFIVVCLSLD